MKTFRCRLAALMAAACAVLAPVAHADPYKTSFGPTTTDISTGHAGHSSIPTKLGYWKQDNVDVNVFGIAGTIAGLQLLTSGKIDFITVSAEGLMLGQAQGMPIKAVYVHARSPINKLVMLKNSKVTTIKQLKGLSVGMPVLENSAYFGGLFKESGLRFDKDVKLIPTGTGAPAALALQRGDIAAWASWDTAIAALQNRGMEFVEYVPTYFDELIGNVIVTRNDMMEKHPEVVVAVARGIAKSVHFGLANPEAAIRIHWDVYPQSRPQGGDPVTQMRDARTIFSSRFDSYKLPAGMLYGQARPEQFEFIAKLMRESGAPLPANYDPKQAYTDRFIADINKFDRNAIEAQAKAWKP